MNEIKDQIAKLAEAIEAIQQNKPFSAMAADGIFSDVIEKINVLGANLSELNAFLSDLSNGKLDINVPSRKNYLAASAKQLHSNLNHLTWQTQQIARGDYKQKVDFIGEFSESFNELTKQLSERENALKARNEILQTVFDHVECLFIFSAEKRNEIFYLNDYAKRTFSIDSENFMCGFVSQLINLDVEKKGQYELFDSGSSQWFEVLATRMKWTNDSPAILFYCINITTHKKKQHELENKTFTDPLTGIYNRRYLDLHVNELVSQGIRERFNITCFMVDIDYFKRLNDNYGHLQGDACLVTMANCLKSIFVRSTDFVARYGGEEFIIVSRGMTPASALSFAEKLRFAVESLEIPLIDKPGEKVRITISIGVCSMTPTPEIQPNKLIALADHALYRSKSSGRNRVTLSET